MWIKRLKVPRHGAILFFLQESGTAPDPVPPSGIYTTRLLLGAPCEDAALKRISITVGKVQSVLSKQSVLILRRFPWGTSWSAKLDIPIKRGSFLPAFTTGGRPVGVLQSDSGGMATVLWTGTTDDRQSKYPKASLLIEQLDRAGTYTGSIVLADEKQGYDGKASAPFELTVLVKDEIYWPIALIFLSVLIAFLVKRYLGVQRLIWNMGLEEASIGEEYREAERKFNAATAGTEYGRYSILKDLAKERDVILNSIANVSKSWGITSIDGNGDYKDASDRLIALHHALSEWGDLGEELAKLGKSLSTALSSGQKGIENTTEVSAAEKLLVGNPIKTTVVDDLSRRVIQATQDLDGLVQNGTGVAGPRLAMAMFGFQPKPKPHHSRVSSQVVGNRRAAFLSRAIREGDIAVALFAVIIAELIGLNTKYLGFKAFGTAKDYVDLFVWGAATKATLDILTTLLDRVSTSLYKQIPRS